MKTCKHVLLCILIILGWLLGHSQIAESAINSHNTKQDSIEILARDYSLLSDFEGAFMLYQRILDEKLKQLPANHPSVIKTLIDLAYTSVFTLNPNDAKEYITEALFHINNHPNSYSKIQGRAYFVHAFIFDNDKDFKKGEALYQKYYDFVSNNFDQVDTALHLEALVEMSEFYAHYYGPKNAFKYAKEAYELSQQKQFKSTALQLMCIRNISNMYSGFGNYQKGLDYSNEGLSLYSQVKQDSLSLITATKMARYVPYLIWVNVRSKYSLNKNKDVQFIEALVTQLEEGFSLLDDTKSILSNQEDFSHILADYALYFDFAKKLQYDLFKMTKDQQYIDHIVNLHESFLYNKIRLRLANQKDLAFSNVPQKIIEREALLKKGINQAIKNSNKLEDLMQAQQDWKVFLDSLQVVYPKYYKMRHASSPITVSELQNDLEHDTSLVRYLFIFNQLFALIIDKEKVTLAPLPYYDLPGQEKNLTINYDASFDDVQRSLSNLYNIVWRPFEDAVQTSKVIIVPDGQLFKIAFEALITDISGSPETMVANSLIHKHTMSYNYSLHLISENATSNTYQDNFIAYAPEFNSEMKKHYQDKFTDASTLDSTYLTLLPQPLSVHTAQKFAERFNGTSYINQSATKDNFITKSGGHKIIHLGTHAESNSRSPELSRLVFAKSTSEPTNYLYTYEIYEQNLNSNLTVLTACETGRPTYQVGEGMISLAHAFNYAGSESILTSLWKIDEQSSTTIIDSFYEYLSEGMAKDEALHKAKLNYLTTAEGRTINPQYWAGLVLIGDVSPIEFTQATSIWPITILVISLIGIGIALVFIKRKRAVKSSP